jgi:hypothetical protein
VDPDIFRRMVLAAVIAIAPGAVVDVDIDEDDADERNVHVSVTVRRSGQVTHGETLAQLPLDAPRALEAMRNAVRSVIDGERMS